MRNIDQRVPTPARYLAFHPGLLETRVLLRVDGHNTVSDIADDLGLTSVEIMAILDRLAVLGAISWLGLEVLPSEELEELPDDDRPTNPDLSHERPTIPSGVRSLPP